MDRGLWPIPIACSLSLLRLNGPQISGQRAGVLARETEGRHVRVPAGQAFAQPVRKIVEVHPIAEIAEGRCRRMRARAGFADGMTGGAHALCQCQTLALKFAWRAVFGGRQARPRKVYDNCKSDRGQSFKHLR
jgi:hypothetical protein